MLWCFGSVSEGPLVRASRAPSWGEDGAFGLKMFVQNSLDILHVIPEILFWNLKILTFNKFSEISLLTFFSHSSLFRFPNPFDFVFLGNGHYCCHDEQRPNYIVIVYTMCNHRHCYNFLKHLCQSHHPKI